MKHQDDGADNKPGQNDFMAHNRRQRRAIRSYIREVTGLDLEDVPQDVQQRLAMKWIRRYAPQFRDENGG